MFKVLLAFHVLFAIFAVGPFVHAATTAARGIRTGDGAATASATRMLRIYSNASVLVVLLGIGLMSVDSPYADGKAGEIGDTWIWLSLALWVLAMAITQAIIVPTLTKATDLIKSEGSVVTLTGRVAASGGAVALIFAGIVFLMVYRPGG